MGSNFEASRPESDVEACWVHGRAAGEGSGGDACPAVRRPSVRARLKAWRDCDGVIQTNISLRGLATMTRVLVLIALASLIWTPIGIYVGLRPHLARVIQPVAQFLAAFPANLVFPVAVSLIVAWNLNPDIWLSPLMVLGTQWYILFNVIAGASALPRELRDAASNFQVKGWLWWKTVGLPAVMPYYVTGAITASGGSWNAAIVAEVVSWGSKTLHAYGLGAYIADATTRGDFPRIVIGIFVMCFFVVIINRLFWRPLYWYAERKFRLA